LRKVFFENISVKPISDEAWFTEKVELIEKNKKVGLPTERFENEIDEMLFKLYELTDSEREIISGNPLPSAFSGNVISAISVSESE
jgi:hypothetical protein